MSSKTNFIHVRSCLTLVALGIVSVFSAQSQTTSNGTQTQAQAQTTAAKTSFTLPALVPPTLEQIAEQQRLKQLAEITKTEADAKLAEAAKKQSLAPAVKVAETKQPTANEVPGKKGKKNAKPVLVAPVYTPMYKMTATYKVKGTWYVELTDGRNLSVIKAGQQYNQFKIEQISDSNMQINGSLGQKTISLGGVF